MKSIKYIQAEYQKLMQIRRALQVLFHGLGLSVSVGGSYALRWHSEKFVNRENHDYDFIVRGDLKGIQQARQILIALLSLGLIQHPGDVQASDSGSWTFGEYEGCKIDIILTEGDACPCMAIESLADIARAKLIYNAKHRRKGLPPRQKDVEDLEILKSILGENHPNIHWDK